MAKVKKKEHENLSDANIKHVINLLEPEDKSKPITKKTACEILNISYNTTRLGKIISEFKEKQEYVSRMKAHNRGKPATTEERADIVKSYLSGENVSEIAKNLFRSPTFVKNVINTLGVPTKPASAEDRVKIAFLPDNCVKEDFNIGDLVWSAKYHKPAVIVKGYYEDKYISRYSAYPYKVYIIEPVDSSGTFFEHVDKGGFYATCLAYDLGSLEHLEKYGVNLDNL